MEINIVSHPFPPLFDENSKILILGSFPSVKSREENFFYGHPQNRFWRVLASLYGSEVPKTIEQKKVFLLANKLALWDVIASCEIEGISDSSIKNVLPNDLSLIFEKAKIERIFVNGKTAKKYYDKYLRTENPSLPDALCLPSTSPANAAYSIDKLCKSWSVIVK